MIFRVGSRKTPETTIQKELLTSFKIPGLVAYEVGLFLIWIGLVWHAWGPGFDPHFTPQVILAILLHAGGIAIMFWAFAVHASWNIQPRLEPDHRLCTSGPYGWVRHPIYLAFNLLGVGSAVWLPTAAVILGAVLIIIGGDLRARAEERVLTATFGDEYRKYMTRVHRALPGVY